MAKSLTILIRSGPYMAMDANLAINLAKAALDKGYGVNIFGYGEGVLCIKNGQGPKRFPNVGKELTELTNRGAKLCVCETCSLARGLKKGEEVEGARIGSLTKDLFNFIDSSERLVTIGR